MFEAELSSVRMKADVKRRREEYDIEVADKVCVLAFKISLCWLGYGNSNTDLVN